MLRSVSIVMFMALVLMMVAIVALSFLADGQRAEEAGFFERAGIAADQMLDGSEGE